MVEHTHRTHVEGCFRCELSKDEVAPENPNQFCPECQQGKVDNCTGWIINADDEVGVCATREQP